MKYKISEKMFLYPTETAAWHFVPITKKISVEIKDKFGKNRKGFGSIPVEVMIGESVWNTSIFPDKRAGLYILPIKAKVRKAENIEAGEVVDFSIRIII